MKRIVYKIHLAKAHIACGAVVLVEGLAEIAKNSFMPACTSCAIIVHVVELDHCNLVSFRLHVAQQALPCTVVATRVEQAAFGLQAVTTRPPGFLLVVLKGLRHTCVNDITNVRFVDAHTERNRRYDGIDFFVDECLLVFLAVLARHACVIGQNVVAFGSQQCA